MKRLKAFTLAEVLIALLIIGVVAAITIPALMQKTQDQELKAAWKKEYSVIANAYNMILNDNGGDIKGVCSNNICFINLFRQKLNVQKYCDWDLQTNCYISSSKIKNLSGALGHNFILASATGMNLADGSVLITSFKATNCDYQYLATTKKYCGSIYVDVNGTKPPNTQGKDIFWIMIDENKLWSAGISGDDAYEDRPDHSCSTDYPESYMNGLGCSAKYLQE